jgi:hypothetical protein
MMRALLAAALLLLPGCAALEPILPVYENRTTAKAETVWLGMHAVDTMQTVTIARNPECYHEANGLAAAIYGSEHPSTGRVVATNLVMAYAHAKLGAYLDRKAEAEAAEDNGIGWYVARGGFYVASFLGTGLAVTNNSMRGIGPLESNACR